MLPNNGVKFFLFCFISLEQKLKLFVRIWHIGIILLLGKTPNVCCYKENQHFPTAHKKFKIFQF